MSKLTQELHFQSISCLKRDFFFFCRSQIKKKTSQKNEKKREEEKMLKEHHQCKLFKQKSCEKLLAVVEDLFIILYYDLNSSTSKFIRNEIFYYSLSDICFFFSFFLNVLLISILFIIFNFCRPIQ